MRRIVLVRLLAVSGLLCVLSLGTIVYKGTNAFFSFITDFSRSEPESVLFLGDVMLGRTVERRIDELGTSALLGSVVNLHEQSRYVVANFEASVPEVHIPTPNFTFRFSVRREHLEELRTAHITHASLANNHAFDHGEDGFHETYTHLREYDIVPFGHPNEITASSTSILRVNDINVGLIGLHTVWREPQRDDVVRAIEELSSTTEYQIAVVHWGTEYDNEHSATQGEYARFLVDAGIDVIIGHHPHVIQDIDLVDDVPVFYSLGNYVFDQFWSDAVTSGLAVRMVPLDQSLTFELVPVRSDRSVPRKADEEERTKILRALAASSHTALQSQIMRGVITIE